MERQVIVEVDQDVLAVGADADNLMTEDVVRTGLEKREHLLMMRFDLKDGLSNQRFGETVGDAADFGAFGHEQYCRYEGRRWVECIMNGFQGQYG
jgi:hypothetical protein